MGRGERESGGDDRLGYTPTVIDVGLIQQTNERINRERQEKETNFRNKQLYPSYRAFQKAGREIYGPKIEVLKKEDEKTPGAKRIRAIIGLIPGTPQYKELAEIKKTEAILRANLIQKGGEAGFPEGTSFEELSQYMLAHYYMRSTYAAWLNNRNKVGKVTDQEKQAYSYRKERAIAYFRKHPKALLLGSLRNSNSSVPDATRQFDIYWELHDQLQNQNR